MSTQINGDIKKINIANAKEIEYFDIASIIDTFNYVYLSEINNFYIGKIDKIKKLNNQYYVLDKNLSKTLFVFDRNGIPIYKKTASLEPRDDEFSTIEDFTLSAKNIFVLSSKKRKVLVYDINGKFIYNIFLPEYFDNIEFFEEKLYCYRTSIYNKLDKFGNYSLLVINLNNPKDKRKFLKVTKVNSYNNFLFTDNVLTKLADGIGIAKWGGDTIYSQSKGGAWTNYCINFGKEKITDNFKKLNNPIEFINEIDIQNRSYVYSSFFETSEYLIFIIKKSGKFRFVAHNKKNNESIIFKAFINSKDRNIQLFQIESIDNGSVLFSYPKELLVSLKEVNSLHYGIKLYDDFKKGIDDSLSGGNPIIFCGVLNH